MRHIRKRKPTLAKQYEQFFVPVLFIPMNMASDLQQPDFRPMINSVVSGGAAEPPVQTWSEQNAKLGAGPKRN